MTTTEILKDFDNRTNEVFDELDISIELSSLIKKDKPIKDFQLKAESIAFDLSENYQDENTGWGGYFGPKVAWRTADGDTIESHSLSDISGEIIDHWEKRIKECRHPVLVARYSGLVWDLKKKIKHEQPSHEVCTAWVNALLQTASNGYFKSEICAYDKLKKALNLSISLNNTDLMKACKNCVINFEKKHAIDDKPGLWGYCFDLLLLNKNIILEEQEEKDIIDELENKLSRLSSRQIDDKKINPWHIEYAVKRLAEYYRRKNNPEEKKRVLISLGNAYDRLIPFSPALQSISWLDHLYKIYLWFGLKDEANEVIAMIQRIESKTIDELKSINYSVELPKEKIDKYIKEMLTGSSEEILTRIVAQFIPSKEETKTQVLDLSKSAPFAYMFARKILNDRGHVVATVGPLENDLEGHIALQVAQNILLGASLLSILMNEISKDSVIDAEKVEKFIQKSGVIKSERHVIISKGISAYFSKDYLVCIHLLIPQIEEAIRNTLELAGGTIYKFTKSGELHSKTFDELLRDNLLTKCLGEDFCYYLRILFSDQRGWNMRNLVCHGLLNPEIFNQQTADRVFHVLLCLALITTKEDSESENK